MPAAARHFLIRDLLQLEALASPVRQEIVDAVEASGPCSIAEVAAMLGRPADSLYYHVRLLEEVRLLVEAGVRDTGHRDEVLYDVPGRPLQARLDPGDPHNRAALRKSVGALLRLTERDFGAALASGDAVFAGRRRNTAAGRYTGWLTAADLAEVNRLLVQIHHVFRRRRAPGRGRLHAFTYALAPLQQRATRQDQEKKR